MEGKKLRDDDGWIRQGAGLAQLGILFFRLFSLFFSLLLFFLLFSRFSFFARAGLAWYSLVILFQYQDSGCQDGVGRDYTGSG